MTHMLMISMYSFLILVHLVFMSDMFVPTESELEVVLVGTQKKERYMIVYLRLQQY